MRLRLFLTIALALVAICSHASEYKGILVPDDAIFLSCVGEEHKTDKPKQLIENIYVLALRERKFLAHRVKPVPHDIGAWRKIKRVHDSIIILEDFVKGESCRSADQFTVCDVKVTKKSSIDRHTLKYSLQYLEEGYGDDGRMKVEFFSQIAGSCKLFELPNRKF